MGQRVDHEDVDAELRQAPEVVGHLVEAADDAGADGVTGAGEAGPVVVVGAQRIEADGVAG